MKFYHNKLCVCGNEECFMVQTQLCELALPPPSSTAGASEPPMTFNPHTSTYQNWLLVLSICHHIPAFSDKFLAMTKFDDVVAPMKNSRQWFINRIHFPRSLLENWSTHKIHRNQSLLPQLLPTIFLLPTTTRHAW
jgi:hypothetical protein